MGKLLPCSRCGVVPFKETRWVTSDSRRYSLTHVCDSRYARDWETLVAEWNAANAPADPAVLALARLGAMVLDWSPLECGFPTMPGGVIDEMAVRSGCALEDSGDGGHECWTAPDVRLTIAALLAPDGAGEVAP